VTDDTAIGARRFALIGAAGFVARRHLDAIRAIGGVLVCAHDVSDSVGVLDSYFPETRFFVRRAEFVDFLMGPDDRVDYLVVCTPSDLHEQDVQSALAIGANVIVEKPPVLSPEGVLKLAALQRQTGLTVHPVLQLRYHPDIEALRQSVLCAPGRHLDIDARYVTRRGPWYHVSWKGDPRRSGTIVYNFGIHLFDVLTWIFGSAVEPVTAWLEADGTRAGGTVRFAEATARWLLSSRAEDLPDGGANSFGWRQFLVGGQVVADFSGDYSGLHRRVYQEVLAGRGQRIEDAYQATLLTDQLLRTATANGQHIPALAPAAVSDQEG
jgi:UDP-N-acetyl-2-amino-2-deoxyglucuronate dehydrogenase